MNKFSFGLHLAMFRQDLENRNFEQLDFLSETERVIEGTQEELKENQQDAINNPDFSGVVDEVIESQRSKGDFEQKKQKFEERLNSKDPSDKKYKEVWTERIAEGLQNLYLDLERVGYFRGSDKEELAKKKIVLQNYHEEIKNQYLKHVWNATDEEFNGNKNKLFTAELADSPVHTIYKRLTDEAERNMDTTRTSYHVAPKEKDEESGTESIKTKKRIDFLAHDLPNYLWGVRDKNFFESVFGNIPLITVKVDIPSLEDKQEIANFIKVVDNLDGENPELVLLEIFHDLEKVASADEIKKVLTEHKISLKNEKYIKDIKKAFDFYKSTQVSEIPVEKQHPLYLSILQIIEDQGGFDKAINAFKKDVEKAKKSSEGKEYKKGKKLDPDYKSFAEKLGISDFTSATRLSEKSSDYFKSTKIVDILADINNDGVMTYTDKGLTKTGLEFKSIYEAIDVGEETALENLLAQAKLLNKVKGLGIEESKFTSEEITNGNKKLILLLQSIIANPGLDLITLMKFGPDSTQREKDTYTYLESLPEGPEDPKVQKAAAELLKDVNIGALQDIEGVASPEGLHQAVAGALYTEYMKGVGFGGKLSFDNWVKGLSLSGGIQIGNGKFGIGLTLGRNREKDLGDGWSLDYGVSGGVCFIDIFGERIPMIGGSAGIGAAKEWLNQNGVEQKLGGKISFTQVGRSLQVYSINLGWERDKLSQLEIQRGKVEKEVNEKIISPLLDKIAEKLNNKEFDLNVPENVTIVENAIDEVIQEVLKSDETKLNNNDMKRLKENLIRHLINYNKAPISNGNIRKYISTVMSKGYSYVWYEQRIKDEDGKLYISDGRLGLSLITMLFIEPVGFAVHAGIGVKKHEADIYGDRERNYYTINAETNGEWTQEMIDKFNKKLPEEAHFSINEEGYIVVPNKALKECDIRINPGMKGLIKKDENNNILLSPKTFMAFPSVGHGTSTKSYLILIGGGSLLTAEKLKSIIKDDSRFTQGDINTEKLTGKEIEFTMDRLNSVLNELKNKDKLKNDTLIQNYNFETSILNKLQAGKKYKITLENKDGKIQSSVRDVTEGDVLQIEYISKEKVELMDPRANRIATEAYGEANKVTTNALYSISHDIVSGGRVVHHKWPLYVEFATAVKNKSYPEAKRIIKRLLPKMDKYINKNQKDKVNFSGVIADLDAIPDDDIALGQVVLSINNIFARVSSVQGGKDGTYHFRRFRNNKTVDVSMSDIIEPRAGEIERRINKSDLSEDVKAAYIKCIQSMEEYRKANPDKYNGKSGKSEILKNSVGINLGNAISVETLLFNPEIYENSQINLNELNFEGKDVLQKHVMKQMAMDKCLIGPVLNKLSIPVDTEITEKQIDYNGGKLTIDINGKKVTFSGDMSFGYFSQCVNHMVLLNNIRAEVEGGDSIEFEAPVTKDGKEGEAVLRTVVSTSSTKVDISFTIHQETPTEPETPTETPTPTSTPTEDPITGTPTSTPGEDIIGEGDEGGGDLPGEGEGL